MKTAHYRQREAERGAPSGVPLYSKPSDGKEYKKSLKGKEHKITTTYSCGKKVVSCSGRLITVFQG